MQKSLHLYHPKKNYFLKFPSLLFFKIPFPSKIFKTATHSRHKQTHSQLDNNTETHSGQGLYNLARQTESQLITAVTVAQLLQKHKYPSKTELCKPFRSLLKGFVFLGDYEGVKKSGLIIELIKL